MVQDLFVRGFDKDLHSRISEISSREDVALSSLVEDAIKMWLEQKGEVSSKHFLLLYDDEESLINMLRISESFTKRSWFRVFVGSESHIGIKFLKKYGWHDATPPSYDRIYQDPRGFTRQMRDRVNSEAKGKRTCAMGFSSGDLAEQRSLREGLEICDEYNLHRIDLGMMYCVTNVKGLLNGDLRDFINLLKSHDQTFMVDKDGLYKLRITDESLYKLPGTDTLAAA